MAEPTDELFAERVVVTPLQRAGESPLAPARSTVLFDGLLNGWASLPPALASDGLVAVVAATLIDWETDDEMVHLQLLGCQR